MHNGVSGWIKKGSQQTLIAAFFWSTEVTYSDQLFVGRMDWQDEQSQYLAPIALLSPSEILVPAVRAGAHPVWLLACAHGATGTAPAITTICVQQDESTNGYAW